VFEIILYCAKYENYWYFSSEKIVSVDASPHSLYKMADNPESRLSNDTNIKIDTSTENLKTLYPVQGVYKARQKSNNGRLLPFETIDKSIYKKQSNCVCFITSEKRIHAWIKEVVQTLFHQFSHLSNIHLLDLNTLRRYYHKKVHSLCPVS
jgi:hypothetical protein